MVPGTIFQLKEQIGSRLELNNSLQLATGFPQNDRPFDRLRTGSEGFRVTSRVFFNSLFDIDKGVNEVAL